MKIDTDKSGVFIALLTALSANCSPSRADDSMNYQITATHNVQGVATPFLDKELSFQVSFRLGSDFEISQTIKANTDAHGQAALNVNPNARPGFKYAGIELFCAKLDGPHYCNGVFATTNNFLNPTDDSSDVLYNCTYSVTEAQADVAGSIVVSCTDK